jgi:hypothetical protein
MFYTSRQVVANTEKSGTVADFIGKIKKTVVRIRKLSQDTRLNLFETHEQEKKMRTVFPPSRCLYFLIKIL